MLYNLSVLVENGNMLKKRRWQNLNTNKPQSPVSQQPLGHFIKRLGGDIESVSFIDASKNFVLD